jgi:hypothetical protein
MAMPARMKNVIGPMLYSMKNWTIACGVFV